MPVASVDPMASRIRRTFPAVGAALLALALVTGCAPEPAPTPTPTGFASDDEAFAAAEATYRAYVDALNAVDLSDPATFEPVYANLSGQALADEKKSLTTMSAEGWVVSGESKVRAFFHGSATETLTAVSCLDVSAIKLLNGFGESQVSPDRPDVYAFKLTFVQSSPTASPTLDSAAAIEDERCAA